MKKQLVAVALVALYTSADAVLIKIPMIGAAAFLNKVGNGCPPFGHAHGKTADIFSSILEHTVTNPEVLEGLIPDPIKNLISRNSHIPIDYKIRISSSVCNRHNQQQEYEAINAPWSIFFHDWAHVSLRRPKTVEWGLYDVVQEIKNKENLMGYDKGWWISRLTASQQPLEANKLHKEQLKVEMDGAEYHTVIPLSKHRFFMTFWTVGYIHDASLNMHKMIVIFEFVIREPSFNTRKNRTAQGVFYPDLNIPGDDEATRTFKATRDRLHDYKQTLLEKNYEPEEPFGQDLREALKKISSTNDSNDRAALDYFIKAIDAINTLIASAPINETEIRKLAEVYASRSTNEQHVRRCLGELPNIALFQVDKIITLAKEIHQSHLNNIESHIANLEENEEYKAKQQELFGGLYMGIHPAYQSAAQRKHQAIRGEALSEESSKQEFEERLQKALNAVIEAAQDSKSDGEFVEKCDKIEFGQDVNENNTYQTTIVMQRKKFMMHEVHNIKESLAWCIGNEADRRRIARLKPLLAQITRIHENMSTLNDIKDEDALVELMSKDVKKIVQQFANITEEKITTQETPVETGAPKNTRELIAELKKCGEAAASYQIFLANFAELAHSPALLNSTEYQSAFAKAAQQTMNRDLTAAQQKAKSLKRTKAETDLKKLKKDIAAMTYDSVDEVSEALFEIQERLEKPEAEEEKTKSSSWFGIF